MSDTQLASGLWVSTSDIKADRVQALAVRPDLTPDQVPSKYRTYSHYLDAILVDWVFSCTSLISYSFAANKWDLIDEEEDPLEDPKDEFLQLMARPNPVMSGFQFLELASFYLELTGNCYITMESRNGLGQPREMYLPNPARMRIIPDPKTFVRGYVYDATGMAGGGERQLIPYKPEEVIHIKWANPRDDYYGLGNVEASSDLLEIIRAMSRHEHGYWASGGRIVGTLQTDQTLTLDEFDDLVRNWASANRDDRQRARVAVLQKGVKYAPIAEGLRSLDLTTIEKAKRDRILAVFGVPLPKLGIMEQSQFKQEDADRTFHGETMTPKFLRWEDGIQPLVDLFHPDRSWRFERKNFEDDTSKLQNANLMAVSGLFTVDEARVYFGAEPLPNGNGNVLLLNAAYTAIPLESLGEMAEQNMEPPPEPGVPGEPVPPEPVVTEVPKLTDGNPAAVADAALSAAVDAGVEVKALSDDEARQIRADDWRRVRLAGAVRRAKAYGGSTPLERTKAYGAKTSALAKPRRERKLLHPAMAAVMERGIKRTTREALRVGAPKLREAFRAQQRRITQPKRLGAILRAEDPAAALAKVWDATDLTTAIRGIQAMGAQQGHATATSLIPKGKLRGKAAGDDVAVVDDTTGYDLASLGERIVGIDETTRSAVVDQISEGLRRGYSPLQIAEGFDEEGYPGISGVFASAQDYRTEMIARTESAYAYNSAADARYRDAGVTEVQVLDGDSDAVCAEIDGQTRPINDVPTDHPNGTRTTIPLFDHTASVIDHMPTEE